MPLEARRMRKTAGDMADAWLSSPIWRLSDAGFDSPVRTPAGKLTYGCGSLRKQGISPETI